MTRYREASHRVKRPTGSVFGALTLVLGFCAFSTDSPAAGPSSPARLSELHALLASNNALSEAAMARQAGTGLRPPAVITGEPGASPRVLLWDEMRIVPLAAPPPSGIVTSGGAGK